MHLPTIASTILLSRAEDPLAKQPDWSKDKFPPYPSMTNADGSNITVENLRGTRLFGWKGCEVEDTKAIAAAFDDFYKLAAPLASNIDWASEVAEDFWGRNEGRHSVPVYRRTQIQQIFRAQQQMYSIGWHLLPPYWTSLWIEVRCSGNDGTGDPKDVCKDRNPNDGKCGRRGQPTGGSGAGGIEAYADSPSNPPEDENGNIESLWYSRITFCNGFFNLPSLSDVMGRTPRQPGQLDSWNNRARVFLHETTHLDYFMNTPGTSPNCSDLKFRWKERGEDVIDWAYGPRFTKILRNYGQLSQVGFYPQRNADSFAWFALGSYVQQQTGTYPRYPRPRAYPLEDPWDQDDQDVRAADADPVHLAAQPLEDMVADSTEDDYEYAEGFSMPKCPDAWVKDSTDSGSDPAPQPSASPPPPSSASPPPPPSVSPSPPPEKTNALSIVFQQTLDEVGPGFDWLFFPGKRGEGMLCHDQNDSWRFMSKNGPSSDVPPWPAGTYHFDDLFGRSCDYKNDGNGNLGMLWRKEQDGKDSGIPCYVDNTRTKKECTKSGLIPSIEHIAMAYCEW